MAPLISLLALFALATTVLASPHISRNVHNHVHRALHPDLDARAPLPLPKRKRSLNKRCVSRPTTNSTSAVPTPTAPINVAPVPSLFASSAPPSLPLSSSAANTTTSSPSAYVPPPTTEAAAPTTSTPPPATSEASSTTSTPAPAPAQTSSSSTSCSFMCGTQQGQGTWFADGLGACGDTNTSTDYICAVSEYLFDTYPAYNGVDPNTNPVCGKYITASYGGKSITVKVVDRCTGCAITDLDFSEGAFGALAATSVGRIGITWDWVI